MRVTGFSLAFLLGLAIQLAHGQIPANKPQQAFFETSVCKISANPSAYNNKLVKVRAYVQASAEYSLLVDERCSESGIWFAFADGSVPPQVEAYVREQGMVGGRDSKGQRVPPIPVQLVKDENYLSLVNYLALPAKGEACAGNPSPALPPDCTTYRVTATFTGRVDGVFKRLHEAHLRQTGRNPIDGKGFGHMGMFDAQIVVQSVEDVAAVDEVELRKPLRKQNRLFVA